MRTEYKLANTLKELMAKKHPLNEISVNLLIKKCKVSRATFYYHFHDMYDLVNLVFLNETIPGIRRVKNLQKVESCIFNYYISNKNFIDMVFESSARDLFVEFLINNLNPILYYVLENLDDDELLEGNEKNNIARFYSIALANSISFYLENAKEKTLEGLEDYLGFISQEFLLKSIKTLAKRKNSKKNKK